MFERCHIERDSKQQEQIGQIFSQMKDILNYHAPQKEPDYMSGSILPMVSVDQAAKELLEVMKNEIDTSK